MAKKNGTSTARANTLQLQQSALELRRSGRGYVDIGNALGISKTHAHRLVTKALQEAKAQIEADAAQMKAEELSRLDAMLAGLWSEARKGSVGAVDRVLKIMERRAKMLGLDAPLKLAGDKDAPLEHRHQHAHNMTDDTLAAIAASGSP